MDCESRPRLPSLRCRVHEQEVLDRLLVDVYCGHSRALVLRGESGVGKTALLTYLADRVSKGRVVGTAGVQSESEIEYSALQQMCVPLLGYTGRLPTAQRAALATTLRIGSGEPPGQLLTGLAVLGLFAEAAVDEPLICVVDDVQWIDRMSAAILAFVARRLDTESVALVFAVSDPAPALEPSDSGLLSGLPELRVDGLCEDAARALLDDVLPAAVPPHVRDRIVAEARGNPLALLELSRDEHCDQTNRPVL
ncbi:ATP-binding protein [Nocardia sp. NPDC046763]|uniref:ATP-binding protein n=1 Tax=Nocardia sp. NPDC046763 TaxID=3155256 RepID=UPI0033CC35D3